MIAPARARSAGASAPPGSYLRTRTRLDTISLEAPRLKRRTTCVARAAKEECDTVTEKNLPREEVRTVATTSAGPKWVFRSLWDFEQDISQDVLREYFKALLVCANGDGELTADERGWCIGYCAAAGATGETLEELQEYPATESIHEVIARGQHIQVNRRPIIYDSIRACSSDAEYNDKEKAKIREMAGIVGVTEGEVAELERIYLDECALRSRRIEAVFPEGTPYR